MLKGFSLIGFLCVVGFAVSTVAHAAYQPPASFNYKGYERSPLTFLFVHKKGDDNNYPLNIFVVAVEINGHPTSLQIDTAGGHTGISSRFLSPLQLVPINEHFNWQREFANGMRVSGVNLPTLVIGGVVYHNVHGSVAGGKTVDVREGASSGFNVAGLLGTDFMRAHDAVVDCAHGGLFLRVDQKAEVITGDLSAKGWTAVPIKVVNSGFLEVQGSINGYRGHFLWIRDLLTIFYVTVPLDVPKS